jgi:hypothetical protein
MGILVHSVIIGLSLGASKSSKTIKPLVAALSFHQFFEGVGLGGCISQVTICMIKSQFLDVYQWVSYSCSCSTLLIKKILLCKYFWLAYFSCKKIIIMGHKIELLNISQPKIRD